MSTFLSEYVTNMYKNNLNSEDYSDCFDNLLFNWKNVGKSLGITEDVSSLRAEHYKTSKEPLWGIITTGGKLIFSENHADTYRVLLKSTKWYCNYDIESIFNKFIKKPKNDNILLEAVLKLTAILDRSLGNLVLLKEKEVPFLFRDLLLAESLQLILGNVPVLFLQLLMGNVLGLNVRNIAWHGFFSKNEISPNLVGVLFLIIPSIGNVLQTKGYNLKNITRRPGINHSVLTAQSLLLKSYSSNIKNCSHAFKLLVKEFPHISKGQQEFWSYCYDLFERKCYGDAVVIILPLMEHMMRSIFCEVNNCQPKKMTAESSQFYITLDCMLEKNYESSENKIFTLLGQRISEMLLDLFNYQQGLRLRDRVSHFEIELNKITEEIANFTIALCIRIIQHLMPKGSVNGSSEVKHISINQRTYEPIFHPTALLKKKMYNAVYEISEWSTLTRPKEFNHYLLWSDNKNYECLEKLLEKIQGKYCGTEDLLQKLITNVILLEYPSLFRPQKELEIVNIFGRICKLLDGIHRNVKVNLNARYILWCSRQMRSRQRETYARMLEYLNLIETFFIFILLLMLDIVQRFSDLNQQQHSFIIKNFKFYLKYAENVNSLSQLDKNRWEDIKNLTNKYCTDSINVINAFKDQDLKIGIFE